MSFHTEEAAHKRATLIAEVEMIQTLPNPYREEEFEKLRQKHEDALSNQGMQYQLIFDNQDGGNKKYVGWASFQWNISKLVTIVWAANNKTMNLAETRIQTDPLLEHLKQSNPSILDQNFLLLNEICVPDAYKGCGHEITLTKRLQQISDTVGVKILLFAEGRPKDSFISLYERELERLETRAKGDAETLQETPDDKVLQQVASYSRDNAKAYRQLINSLRRAAEKTTTYPQETFHRLGFMMAGPPINWSRRKDDKGYGEVPIPQIMCPMEYLPKTWGFPVTSPR
ncbi:hypothetical protein F5Y05DRAFT_414632 [Hypoxylon sp. FL0543]|nr:hypothetical protein F5Y05DRAFT_414632 [Hypoxylon sp. FL0543]